MIITVPITLEQIVEETRHWPPEKVGELVGRLTRTCTPAIRKPKQPGNRKLAAAWPRSKTGLCSRWTVKPSLPASAK